MPRISRHIFALSILSAAICPAQWELGALGGFGFHNNRTVAGRAGTAAATFRSGPAWGFLGAHDTYRFVSGEMRYVFRATDPKLSQGQTTAAFNGHAHLVHADFLVHARKTGSRIRPFLSAGGGIKVFRGTGTETAAQPLNRFALLTKTREVKPLLSAGGGVKFALSPHFSVRAEFRDYITPFPERVIAPAPGASIGGLLHDLAPLIGLSVTF